MKQFGGFVVAAALVAAGVPAAPARADSRSDDARAACSDRVRGSYGASTRNPSVRERGYDRYTVTGDARRDGETARFTCQTDRGSVQSLKVDSWKRGGGGGGDAVAAVGIAVGLAAIIAAASSKKKNDNYDRYGQQDYYRNNNGYYNNYENYNKYPQYSSGVFSPSGGIVCYRAQRACFDKHNNYNVRWTQREFDY